MFCTQCGTEINEGSKFCPQCGASLEVLKQPSQSPRSDKGRLLDTVPSYDDRNSVRSNGDFYEYKSKRNAAFWWCFFLGSFGAHKFYLGNTQEGFIMLAGGTITAIFSGGASFFITSLIACVECILMITKTPDQFDIIYIQGKRKWF